MRRKTKGVIFGSLGAACYGTNPLFALPLYSAGLDVNSVLFYRYFFAVVIFGFWIVAVKKVSLKINLKSLLVLFPMGIIFSLSSLLLFMSYNYIDAGIASTILFVYPVMVAVIMAVFFKEKISYRVILAIVLTTMGILLFYKGKTGEVLNVWGIALVLLSSLAYALYMIGIKKLPQIKQVTHLALTFYVMLFGLSVYVVNLKFCTQLQVINKPELWLCALSLAVFPTIVSLETMTISIKLIGPTLSAILGALEPVTAIFFGVVIFHEQLTARIITGIILILASVFLIVLKSNSKRYE